MLKKRIRALLVSGALLGASFPAWPQTSADRLAHKYSDFAGSESNAAALVSGLRGGSDITLSSTASGGGGTVTIDPPTGKMGFGNVNIALALAQASLKEQGIANPTPAQLQAALNGGAMTGSSGKTVQLPGVLRLRAEGKGWGEVAHSLGFKLGEVVRAEKAARAPDADAKREPKPDRVARAERPDRPARPERAERPDKPERAERPGR
jgi:hypothetical protein